MRVLFTTQPTASHWHQLVPLAQALAYAGHVVAFASNPGFCRSIEANGFRAIPVGRDETEEEAQQIWEQIATSGEQPPQVPVLKYWFAGTRADRMLPDILDIMNDWRPEVVVREHTELTGGVAAEREGIPHVTFLISAPVPWFLRAMSGPLNRLLASVGLAHADIAATLYRYLLLYPRPHSLWNPDVPPPPTLHTFRYTGFSRSGEESLSHWAGELDARPTVYATLGTVQNQRTDLFSAILDGLREEPVNLVLTVGRNRDPEEFGPQPAHVHVERYIPQSMLLPLCDLVIAHGGSGTMLDALAHGLPMVMIPMGADQPVNARLCAELGVARVVTPDAVAEEDLAADIRRAARDVLDEPKYRENAQHLRKEIEALPGLDYPVALLEKLAANRVPLRTEPATS
jgi:UDP:flavonoid glycosyltransferase YjiC (YdhE family)